MSGKFGGTGIDRITISEPLEIKVEKNYLN